MCDVYSQVQMFKLQLSIVLVWIDCHHTPEVREPLVALVPHLHNFCLANALLHNFPRSALQFGKSLAATQDAIMHIYIHIYSYALMCQHNEAPSQGHMATLAGVHDVGL